MKSTDFHRKNIFFLLPALLFSLSLFGEIEDLIIALCKHKKAVFAQNYSKPPKANFRQFFKELPLLEKKFSSEVIFLRQNNWSIKTLYHVFVGEYLTKEEAEKINDHMQTVYQQRLNSKKGKVKPPKQPDEFLPGIMSGGHTTKIIDSLSNSCELDGSDDFQVIEPINKSCKVLVPKIGKGYMTNTYYKQSFALTSNGDKVVGIKTLWPDAWDIKDIIIASGALAKYVQQNNVKPVSRNLYTGTDTRQGIQVSFEARIDKQFNGMYVVATTYPKPTDAVLYKVLKKRTKATSNTNP